MKNVCHLIEKTPVESELTPTRLFFEMVKELEDESHIKRYILKCRKCPQLYFFEFYEEIDWEDGEDPQYVTYIPIKSVKEGLKLNNFDQIGLLSLAPRLQVDWPKGKIKSIKWVK